MGARAFPVSRLPRGFIWRSPNLDVIVKLSTAWQMMVNNRTIISGGPFNVAGFRVRNLYIEADLNAHCELRKWTEWQCLQWNEFCSLVLCFGSWNRLAALVSLFTRSPGIERGGTIFQTSWRGHAGGESEVSHTQPCPVMAVSVKPIWSSGFKRRLHAMRKMGNTDTICVMRA